MSKVIDFTKLPIGTEVWYLREDKGVIDEILPDPNHPYPVHVQFGEWRDWFTVNGCIERGSAPVLFLRPFDLVIPDEAYELPAPPDPPIDTVCYVSNDEGCGTDKWYVVFWKGRDRYGRPMGAHRRNAVVLTFNHVRFTDPYLEAGE
jgi:hypothetical protein